MAWWSPPIYAYPTVSSPRIKAYSNPKWNITKSILVDLYGTLHIPSRRHRLPLRCKYCTRSAKPDLSPLKLTYGWAILCCVLEGHSDIGFFLSFTENNADSTFQPVFI